MLSSLRWLWRWKRQVMLFIAIFGLLYLVFVGAFAGGIDLQSLRSELSSYFSGGLGRVVAGTAMFGSLIASATVMNDQASTIYQVILFVLMSLVFIRLLRRSEVDKLPSRLKDAFYKGTSQLIPLLMVLAVLLLELIPLAIATYVVSVINQNGLATTNTEWFAIGSVAFLMVFLTLYLTSGSLLAVHIVTLPDMTPTKALRSAHAIANVQRWTLIRRIALLVLWLLVFTALIIVPSALYLPLSVQWLEQFVVGAVLLVDFVMAHTYFYLLYRSML